MFEFSLIDYENVHISKLAGKPCTKSICMAMCVCTSVYIAYEHANYIFKIYPPVCNFTLYKWKGTIVQGPTPIKREKKKI